MIEILDTIRQTGGDLRVKAPKGLLSSAERRLLAEHKAALVKLLAAEIVVETLDFGEAIDPLPCSRCGLMEMWQTAAGTWRCLRSAYHRHQSVGAGPADSAAVGYAGTAGNGGHAGRSAPADRPGGPPVRCGGDGRWLLTGKAIGQRWAIYGALVGREDRQCRIAVDYT